MLFPLMGLFHQTKSIQTQTTTGGLDDENNMGQNIW